MIEVIMALAVTTTPVDNYCGDLTRVEVPPYTFYAPNPDNPHIAVANRVPGYVIVSCSRPYRVDGGVSFYRTLRTEPLPEKPKKPRR